MAISFQFGSGAQSTTAATFSMYPWQYDDAMRVISDNGSSARMTDILAPLDKKTTAKVTLDKIANVYTTLADGAVSLDDQTANTSGGTVFAELKTLTTDSEGKFVPMVGRIELRLPNHSEITESDVSKLIMATLGLLCDDAGSPIVVTEKMRGALTPAGI